jgi:SNF2 family DNA or RNA helicase
MNTLRELREVFGDLLEVDPELWEWAKVAKKKERTLRNLSRRSDAKLSRLPAVSRKLSRAMGDRTYQRVGARFVAAADSVLIADEPGLGKTVTSLAGLVESGLWSGSHLIVCPKSSIETVWARQIALWFGDKAVVVTAPEGAKKREKAIDDFFDLPDDGRPRFFVVNPAMLRRAYGQYCPKCSMWKEDVGKKKVSKKVIVNGKPILEKTVLMWPLAHAVEGHNLRRTIRVEDWPRVIDAEWTSVIVDEAHSIFTTYRPKHIPQNTQGILDLKTSKKIALTGTPLRGREQNLWGLLDWFEVKMGGYHAFVDSYFEVIETHFGKQVGGLRKEKREAFYSLIDSSVLRRTRLEVRGDLPPGRRIDVEVTMSEKHARQYQAFVEMGEVEIESGSISGHGLLSELTRLKQMAYGVWDDPGTGRLVATDDSPKAEFVLEWLAERGVTGAKSTTWLPEEGSAYKYVIGSQLTEVLNAIERALTKAGIETMRIDGSVSGANRKKYQDSFQADTRESAPRVMLIQTQTGGVAIELDSWCDEMIILDETFVADDQVQLEGRTDNRSGRIAPRSWTYVRTAGTIEEKIAEGNYTQHDVQHKLLDGRRGVNLALHLMKG